MLMYKFAGYILVREYDGFSDTVLYAPNKPTIDKLMNERGLTENNEFKLKPVYTLS